MPFSAVTISVPAAYAFHVINTPRSRRLPTLSVLESIQAAGTVAVVEGSMTERSAKHKNRHGLVGDQSSVTIDHIT